MRLSSRFATCLAAFADDPGAFATGDEGGDQMEAVEALTQRGRARLNELGLRSCELGAPGALARALGWSDFLHRYIHRRAGEGSAFLDRAAGTVGCHELRQEGDVETGLALIALREMTGIQSVRASVLGATVLAESTLARALAAERQGNSELIVFGLGKLGGRELNFYSDLDLVFAYSGQTERDELLYVRRARRLLARMEGGFRIDLRLRPFGQSGPAVMSLAAMEAYFQNHGREWERYAWIKARPVAGNRRLGREFLERLHPFIYRRYLDYHAVEALRELKRQIAEDAGTSSRDLKRGPGGIREIEFIVQAFQLVRGGRTRSLVGSRLLGALKAVVDLELLDRPAGHALENAYWFLRRVENRLQMQALAPVHHLPEDGERQAWLAGSLGYSGWQALSEALDIHRGRVRAIFDDVFGESRISPARSAAERLWLGEISRNEAEELGFKEPVRVIDMLNNFRGSRAVRLMSVRGRVALDRVASELVAAAAVCPEPDAVLTRLFGIISSLVRRSSYLALLVERPAARQRLVELATRSPWLAERIAATPAVLDELLDPRLAAPFSRARLAHHFHEIHAGEHAEDVSAEALRETNETQRLKIAAGLADGTLGNDQAERELSVLAELSVRAALELALKRMSARHGELSHELLAIGYGKLGSRELGLGSDLDIVFIYAERSPAAADGLSAETYVVRVAQRAISLLSMPTTAGRLYTVDTRLRPEGAAGLLISRFEAWRRYQWEHAWLWERQALLRARPVAGSVSLARRFMRVRTALLIRPVPRDTLAREIAAMRSRVAALGPRRTDNAAALLDGEFLAAFWLLAAAPDDPAVVRSTAIRVQLSRLAARGGPAGAVDLAEALEVLRAAATRRVLGLGIDAIAEQQARNSIAELWRRALGGAPL